jgi:hypothetical protein
VVYSTLGQSVHSWLGMQRYDSYNTTTHSYGVGSRHANKEVGLLVRSVWPWSEDPQLCPDRAGVNSEVRPGDVYGYFVLEPSVSSVT